METRHRMFDARKDRLGPRTASVGGFRFHDAVARAGQHPERAVLLLDDHVLVPVGIREGPDAAPFPGRTLVGRDEDIRAAQWVEFGEAAPELAKAGPLVERNGQHPLAGGEHGRFVERDTVPDAAGIGPDRRIGVGILADRGPDAGAAIEHVHRLIEDEPESPFGIRPEIANQNAAFRPETVFMGIEHDARARPGLAVIVAGSEDEEGIGTVPTRDPTGPKPPARRALDADGHAVVELVVVVLGKGRGIHHRRYECMLSNLFHLRDAGGSFFGRLGRMSCSCDARCKEDDDNESVFHGFGFYLHFLKTASG